MKISILIPALLIFVFSCKKDEELITGPMSGKIFAYDQYGFQTPAPEDAMINLFKDASLIDTTSPNSAGQYFFENIPYGRYSIHITRPVYVESRYDKTVYHIGGKSPTLTNLFLFAVPDYQLNLDSIRIIDHLVVIFLKYNGDTLLPVNIGGMALRVFAGNTPEVSKDNFTACSLAYLSDYAINDLYPKFTLHARYPDYNMEISFEQLKNDIIYMRIYPVAGGQGVGRDYYPEALGPPSNVISFRWDEISSQ